MNILVVNDDSISAPGIALLAKAAMALGDVWVVAPEFQCSAMSQKLTLREPLAVKKVEDFPVDVRAAWQVSGTPVDCVKVALDYFLPEKPDYVFSGINNGYNAGFDIAYSARGCFGNPNSARVRLCRKDLIRKKCSLNVSRRGFDIELCCIAGFKLYIARASRNRYFICCNNVFQIYTSRVSA